MDTATIWGVVLDGEGEHECDGATDVLVGADGETLGHVEQRDRKDEQEDRSQSLRVDPRQSVARVRRVSPPSTG
jgi:hypothetical protein